jgi:hypothetical protein
MELNRRCAQVYDAIMAEKKVRDEVQAQIAQQMKKRGGR